MPNDRTSRSGPDRTWYRSPYLLLVVVGVVVALALVFRPSAPRTGASPASPGHQAAMVATPVPSPVPTGPNLLHNPTFVKSAAGWTVFHNAVPMRVTFGPDATARVALGGATNSVEEVFQYTPVASGTDLVVGGKIGIAGAPLPAGASVVCLLIDASGKPTNAFTLTPSNGTGLFPFSVGFTPSGTKLQFVIGVFLGPTSGPKTVVTVKDVFVKRAATASTAN